MDKVVTTFRKNSHEEVRAGIQEFKGRHYAFVRVFVENDVGETVPTKKGLTLSVDLLPRLFQTVRALATEAVTQGLVEPESFSEELAL